MEVLNQKILKVIESDIDWLPCQRCTPGTGESREVGTARQAVPEKPPIEPPGTLPNLADHVRIGLCERAHLDPGSNERLWVIHTTAWIGNDTVVHSIQA